MDYNLTPYTFDPSMSTFGLGNTGWSHAVPAEVDEVAGSALTVFDQFRDHDWIVNSRNTADEDVVRTVASMAGLRPRIAHRADSLELVQDMVVAGLGVGLLPSAQGGLGPSGAGTTPTTDLLTPREGLLRHDVTVCPLT